MAKCSGCGAELPGDAIFCPKCATPVSAAPAATGMPVGVATISGLETIAGTTTVSAGGKPELAQGEIFHARYVIERRLGAGAMGVVYVATDQVTRTRVALKLINPALADKPPARERFVREGLMARDVRHSNIVAMYDVGEVAGQVYLVMEYLNGETLRKWLHRTLQSGRDISFDTARAIIRSVLEGLAAAHATGVVHRDLKPENVMLTGDPDKGDFGLKILDFGIARAVGAPSHVTTTSSSTGTPLYMAPEQKTAADTVGPPADLYAVTAMLYELLLGVAPEGRWALPSKERNDLPAGVDAVIETGLANRPRSRYQKAVDYISALDGIGTGVVPKPGEPRDDGAVVPAPPHPVAVSPLTWLTRLPGWVLWRRLSRTQRFLVGGATVIALIAVIALSLQQEPANLAGRWADEITGTGVAVAFVDFAQQQNVVSGTVYDTSGNQAATFRGNVRGRSLEYTYLANNGATGSGRGQVTEDGAHLDVEVRDNATGITQRHMLHRNHMPPQ